MRQMVQRSRSTSYNTVQTVVWSLYLRLSWNSLTPVWIKWLIHFHVSTYMHAVDALTHKNQTTKNSWGWEIQRLMGSYGRWQSVLHAQTNGVWQLPLRKTCGCFFSLFFFITAWLAASAFYQTPIVYLCSVQSHLRWQAIRGEPLPLHPLVLSSLCFVLSVSFLPFLLRFFSNRNNKWVLIWHVGFSPLEIHNFIIKSGKAQQNLWGTIMWQVDPFSWLS